MIYPDYYSTPGVRDTCHDVKQSSNPELREAAIIKISAFLIDNFPIDSSCTLIPAPQHSGHAEYTLDIAENISFETGAAICDVVGCVPHESLHSQKAAGRHPLPVEFFLTGPLPSTGRLLLVDNIISSGSTFNGIDELVYAETGQILEPLVYAINYPALEDDYILSLLGQLACRDS